MLAPPLVRVLRDKRNNEYLSTHIIMATMQVSRDQPTQQKCASMCNTCSTKLMGDSLPWDSRAKRDAGSAGYTRGWKDAWLLGRETDIRGARSYHSSDFILEHLCQVECQPRCPLVLGLHCNIQRVPAASFPLRELPGQWHYAWLSFDHKGLNRITFGQARSIETNSEEALRCYWHTICSQL